MYHKCPNVSIHQALATYIPFCMGFSILRMTLKSGLSAGSSCQQSLIHSVTNLATLLSADSLGRNGRSASRRITRWINSGKQTTGRDYMGLLWFHCKNQVTLQYFVALYGHFKVWYITMHSCNNNLTDEACENTVVINPRVMVHVHLKCLFLNVVTISWQYGGLIRDGIQ